MSNEPFKVAIAGLGTVGGGTVKVLEDHKDVIAKRCGRPVVVSAVSALTKEGLDFDVEGYDWYSDALDMATNSDADMVVELIGGSDGIAKKIVEAALQAGKHVVTANKALVAHHGAALDGMAEASGVSLNYEAAVAGGIPVIKSIRESLAGNTINKVQGILNGTCNYILTTMRVEGSDFSDVLKDAQELGYAEADPTFDIEGIDAAHKLAILASVAFGVEINFKDVHVEGITHVSAVDIEFAEELGYRIKLLGVAERRNGTVEQRVHPTMVPLSAPISQVEGVFNSVVIDGDAVDTVVLVGRGAGELPTASAVVGDICDIARGLSVPTFSVPVSDLEKVPTRDMAEHVGAYYVRLSLTDEPGVFADVAAALRDNNVSMESMIQRGREEGKPVPVVMTTHETKEADMVKALAAIEALDRVVDKPCMIRIEGA
ncbi:homoserine dehydrogenase [Magnetovibrio sp. PR-2]|uniref:homoserine dehydrogenase n=1 Tax=Magnetovibrio sp. PR-2 TaxID=3120356 RepID=UPI002FCDF051